MTARERRLGSEAAGISAAGTEEDTSRLLQVRSRKRHLEVELNRHDSLIRGPGSRELYVSTTGRPPVWLD